MSSTNKTANYELSQFVGTDIPSILNDYNGDMRKIDSAIHNASVAGGDNATAIAELQTTTARMNTEIGGINSTVNTLSGKVVGVEEVIPATASAQNKLLTAQELPEIPSIEGLENDVATLQNNVSSLQENVNSINSNISDLDEFVDDVSADVKAIQLCVPANASESNKLATMEDIPSGGSGHRVIYESSANENATTALPKIKSAIDALSVEDGLSAILQVNIDGITVCMHVNNTASGANQSFISVNQMSSTPYCATSQWSEGVLPTHLMYAMADFSRNQIGVVDVNTANGSYTFTADTEAKRWRVIV